MSRPETTYVKVGDVHIAYQVSGSGPDLMYLSAGGNHADLQWEEPAHARFLERLGSFSRLIMFDLRGSGLSDRTGELPSFEHQVDDALAVLEVTKSERTILFAYSQAGPLAMLLAATYPDRVPGLILYGSYARTLWAPDYPWGRRPEIWAAIQEIVEAGWGSGAMAELLAPSRANDPAFRTWFGRFQRAAASPGEMHKLLDLWRDTDVRDILGTIRVPTLVLHRRDDAFRDIAHSRYLAEHIPGARLVELPGADHVPSLGDPAPILDEVEEFVTGVRPTVDADRVLATVLFVDIVDSTGHASRLGDRVWRELLERFYGVVAANLDAFRGRQIKTLGDGVLATFDAPARALRSARAIAEAVRPLGLQVRVGVHTGECEAIGNDVGGLAVHVGARVTEAADPGEVLASSTVRDLTVGSGLSLVDRGMHELRGVPGEWHLFALAGAGAGRG